MGLGTEVFTMPGSKFKAVCINPVEDPEKIKEISQRYYQGLVNALEITFGEAWATEIFKIRGWTQEDFIKVGDKYELREKKDKDCSNE
ncbi:hypothetical protein [uncultured Clostridium sp.]|jgi:hypothetical protein|uniref:hypothetical protein n=1 Tax=uncultured Clostridium sp. TaxID=59620 RepID=UPI00206E77E1|nr:hypothetical protein [uncultured Clostridium sp.]DAU87275.1 MAG TPA: hypothetical protein [Caudoviricetes sp.]